jgi:hypothetical protein
VVHPQAVDCAALPGVGWRPRFSNEEALSVLLADRADHTGVVGRQITPKDAAIKAAGAAFAVIGTAAIVWHARKKNKP